MPAVGEFSCLGTEAHTLRLWDLESGSTVQAYRHEGAVVGATVLDRGQRALSWSVDGSLRLWDLRGGEPGEMRPGHGDKAILALERVSQT